MKKVLLKTSNMSLLFICLLFFCSCSKFKAPSAPKIRLSEVTRSVFYAPQYVALQLGFFEEQGLNVELTSAEGSEKTMTALLASQADIGLLGSSSVISVHSQGKEDTPILFAGLTQRDGSFLVGRNPDFSWGNLRGKEIIAGRKGGVPEMVLEYILKKHDLDHRTDVKLLNNIQFNLMSVAFSRGVGDYVALFEPTASLIVREKSFYILKALGQECDKVAYTGYCCLKSYLENHSDIIKFFVKAIYKAQKWMQTHSAQEIAEVVAPYFIDADAGLLTSCIENYFKSDVWCQEPTISPESFDLMQEIMISAGELENKIKFSDVVQNQYAQEAIKCLDS